MTSTKQDQGFGINPIQQLWDDMTSQNIATSGCVEMTLTQKDEVLWTNLEFQLNIMLEVCTLMQQGYYKF